MADAPGAHPEPPADLHARKPVLRTWTKDCMRVHWLHRDPLFFGRGARFRFDAPDGSYGVCYVGADAHAAFIETLGQQTGCGVVTTSTLRQRGIARGQFTRPLRLIDLASSGGLARIGADARLFAGEYTVARRWSAALRSHPVAADGILYPTRHDPARLAIAVFGDCSAHVFAERLGCLADATHAALLGSICDTYGFGVIDA